MTQANKYNQEVYNELQAIDYAVNNPPGINEEQYHRASATLAEMRKALKDALQALDETKASLELNKPEGVISKIPPIHY